MIFFIVAPCCSQGVTLHVTLRCRPVVCLSVCGRTLTEVRGSHCPLTGPVSTMRSTVPRSSPSSPCDFLWGRGQFPRETFSVTRTVLFLVAALELEQTRQQSSRNAHAPPSHVTSHVGGRVMPDDVNLIMYNRHTDPTNNLTTVIGQSQLLFNVVS